MRGARIGAAWLAAGVALALCASCGDCKPDVDNEQPKALRINPGILVKDSLDADCDSIDWKDFSYYEAVRVTVTFAFGEMYKPHGVEGDIRLFRFDGNQMQQQPIVSETRDYTFVFVAEKDKDYFFQIQARKGSAGYMVETKVEPLDSCASCPSGSTCCRPSGLCCPGGTVCRDGACLRTDECSPSCRGDTVCEGGRCVEACPGGCRKPKRCDVDERRCVGGDAAPVKVTPARPKGCQPACKGGQTCNDATGECEGGDSISGSVLSVTEDGGGSDILINRGSQDGVHNGATGSIGGFSFTVRNVTATRCHGKVAARPDALKNFGKVRIGK